MHIDCNTKKVLQSLGIFRTGCFVGMRRVSHLSWTRKAAQVNQNTMFMAIFLHFPFHPFSTSLEYICSLPPFLMPSPPPLSLHHYHSPASLLIWSSAIKPRRFGWLLCFKSNLYWCICIKKNPAESKIDSVWESNTEESATNIVLECFWPHPRSALAALATVTARSFGLGLCQRVSKKRRWTSRRRSEDFSAAKHLFADSTVSV